jgi:hypothetical protein
MIDLLETGLGAFLGGGGAALAHRGGAFYHDALRPLAPDLRSGSLDRVEGARYGWGVSYRFVVWFALPFSLLSGAVGGHLVFLPADVIGIRVRARAFAILAGALLGAAVFAAVELAHSGLGELHVDVIAATRNLIDPILWLYPAVPFLAALKLPERWRASIAVGAAEVVVAAALALLDAPGAVAPAATLAGALVLIAGQLAPSEAPVRVPEMQATGTHIREALPLLLLIGAAVAALANFHRIAGEPMTAMLIGDGREFDAAIIALLTAVAFMPLVLLSATAADSYSTQGTPDWIPALGYVLPGAVAAAVGGALLMAVEAAGAERLVPRLLARPGLSRTAAAVRESLGDVALLALLFGGLWMSVTLGGGLGLLAAGGAWLLNEQFGAPVTRLAVTPSAAIAVGLGANIWHLVS